MGTIMVMYSRILIRQALPSIQATSKTGFIPNNKPIINTFHSNQKRLSHEVRRKNSDYYLDRMTLLPGQIYRPRPPQQLTRLTPPSAKTIRAKVQRKMRKRQGKKLKL